MMNGVWHLYVLSCNDGTLYTGISNNVARRLVTHNLGRGAKYTRSRRPCTLLDSCPFPSKSSCLKAEHAFKRLSRRQKEDALRAGLQEYHRLKTVENQITVTPSEGHHA